MELFVFFPTIYIILSSSTGRIKKFKGPLAAPGPGTRDLRALCLPVPGLVCVCLPLSESPVCHSCPAPPPGSSNPPPAAPPPPPPPPPILISSYQWRAARHHSGSSHIPASCPEQRRHLRPRSLQSHLLLRHKVQPTQHALGIRLTGSGSVSY